MYCISCGKILPPDATFCPLCGKKREIAFALQNSSKPQIANSFYANSNESEVSEKIAIWQRVNVHISFYFGLSLYFLIYLIYSLTDDSACKRDSDVNCIEYSMFLYPIYADSLFTNVGVMALICISFFLAIYLTVNRGRFVNKNIVNRELSHLIDYIILSLLQHY